MSTSFWTVHDSVRDVWTTARFTQVCVQPPVPLSSSLPRKTHDPSARDVDHHEHPGIYASFWNSLVSTFLRHPRLSGVELTHSAATGTDRVNSVCGSVHKGVKDTKKRGLWLNKCACPHPPPPLFFFLMFLVSNPVFGAWWVRHSPVSHIIYKCNTQAFPRQACKMQRIPNKKGKHA